MFFFDKTFFIFIFLSSALTFMLYSYDHHKDNKIVLNDYYVKIFVLLLSFLYLSYYIYTKHNNNPINNVYKCNPDF